MVESGMSKDSWVRTNVLFFYPFVILFPLSFIHLFPFPWLLGEKM